MEGTTVGLPNADDGPAGVDDGEERELQDGDAYNNSGPPKRRFLKRGEGVYRRVYAKKFKKPTQSSNDTSPVAHSDPVFEGRSSVMETSQAHAPFLGSGQPSASALAYSRAHHPSVAPQTPVRDAWGEFRAHQ